MNADHVKYIRKHRDNRSVKEIADVLGISCREVREIYETHYKEWEKRDFDKEKENSRISRAKPVVGYPLEGDEVIRFASAYAAEAEGFHAALIYSSIKGQIKVHRGYAWRYEGETIDIEEVKRSIAEKKPKKPKNTRAVVGYPVAGGEPIWFRSALDAKEEGFSTSTISGCLHGLYKQHRGYIWRYAEEEVNIEKIRDNVTEKRGKPVIGFPLKGGEAVWFKSSYAAEIEGFYASGVSACIRGKIKQYKGYIWKYAEDQR